MENKTETREETTFPPKPLILILVILCLALAAIFFFLNTKNHDAPATLPQTTPLKTNENKEMQPTTTVPSTEPVVTPAETQNQPSQDEIERDKRRIISGKPSQLNNNQNEDTNPPAQTQPTQDPPAQNTEKCMADCLETQDETTCSELCGVNP